MEMPAARNGVSPSGSIMSRPLRYFATIRPSTAGATVLLASTYIITMVASNTAPEASTITLARGKAA